MPKQGLFAASQRMLQVQDPIIPQVADWIRRTPGTISMAQGVVNYGPPTQAIAAINIDSNNTQLNHYGLANGAYTLREAIGVKLQRENQINLTNLDCIYVTAGANMGFLNALLAITQPGDEIILLAPYYFNHEMAVNMVSCNAVVVPTNEQFQPDIDKIAAAITHKTRAIVTVSPNNPTGAVYSTATLTAINQLCAHHGVFHISDEAYEYFHYDDSQHYSPASANTAFDHTISLFSFSKSYGVAGWRIGYMVVPESLVTSIRKIQDTNLICANRLSQTLAQHLLQHGKPYCQSQSEYLKLNREICRQALVALGESSTLQLPQGAFYFFIRLASTHDSLQLVQQLIDEFQVAVLPGNTFGVSQPCYLRVSYGALSPDQCSSAMERLVAGLGRMIC